jgi:hypothetical protein
LGGVSGWPVNPSKHMHLLPSISEGLSASENGTNE